MWACGLDWAGPGQRQLAHACECGDEPSVSVKCGEFLDQLQASQLLKKDSAPWSKYVIRPLQPGQGPKSILKPVTKYYMDHVTITDAHYPSSILPYLLYSAYRKPPDSSSAFCTLKILGKPPSILSDNTKTSTLGSDNSIILRYS